MSLILTAVSGLPVVQPGDDLAGLLIAALAPIGLESGDILVVCQKVVSKAEGRICRLDGIAPSPFALEIAAQTQGKDPRIVEIILRESKRIVRMDRGHLIVETRGGWVCANAGVDESNAPSADTVILLPEDPDLSAHRLRDALQQHFDRHLAVLITDTFGRPWREGLVDFALGVAGMDALLDLRGATDMNGRELHHTVMAQADALAAAAGLLMIKGAGLAAVLVRGYRYPPAAGTARSLVRARELDLFR
ncbi:MAG TPA: coenzyme F420-0:L-glutamate ligase [Terriglobales bacterium]|nr:coenzyme F420-0:L-glutamate ligase [Terriglobales bacterium]